MDKIKYYIRKYIQNYKLLNILYYIVSNCKTKLCEDVPDEIYLKRIYKNKTGKKLNLDNPKGFCEKLQWLKLYNRNPLYTIMVDKVKAKEYVSEIIGEEYIIPNLGVYDSPGEIDFDTLPNKFVLKCNHNSGGGMCICKDKTKINVKLVKLALWLGLQQNSFFASREWPYKNVPRKILAECYMEESDIQSLIDYKFYCFNGIPKFLYVGMANYKNGAKNDELTYLDMDWNPVPFYRTDHKPFPFELKKPYRFCEMVELVKKLSKGIPFVRVDLYCIEGKIYFSEFTFFPGGGNAEFKPYEWEQKIGSWIDLSTVRVRE